MTEQIGKRKYPFRNRQARERLREIEEALDRELSSGACGVAELALELVKETNGKDRDLSIDLFFLGELMWIPPDLRNILRNASLVSDGDTTGEYKSISEVQAALREYREGHCR